MSENMDKNTPLYKGVPIVREPQRQFQTIKELINDAIKYDCIEEVELSNECLKTLVIYVNKFIRNNHPLK